MHLRDAPTAVTFTKGSEGDESGIIVVLDDPNNSPEPVNAQPASPPSG